MNVQQALETAHALALGLFSDDASLNAQRTTDEEAIQTLLAAWRDAPAGSEPCSFDTIRALADRNRATCDEYGAERLRDASGDGSLARKLSDDDLVRGVAALQHRSAADVAQAAGPGLRDLGVAYVERPVSGMVCGVDLETTDRYPDRGYIVNVGLQFMELTPTATADTGYVSYCGVPEMYREKGVPLADIHHITWGDLEGKKPFRENRELQAALLESFRRYPFMAHNAAFEDSWFMLHLDGYAEARKAGEIVPIDTRDICRRIDPDYKSLPHDSRPAALESWALRRGTLREGEKERHLGLDDVDLMLRTVQAEFRERNMFA